MRESEFWDALMSLRVLLSCITFVSDNWRNIDVMYIEAESFKDLETILSVSISSLMVDHASSLSVKTYHTDYL